MTTPDPADRGRALEGAGAGTDPRPVTGPERTHELDGLRGVAIALVVALHSVSEFALRVSRRAGVPFLGDTVTVTTYSGLELFFVLSGALMLGPYLSGGRRFDARRYARRRVRRIWPPYLVALAFGGAVLWVAGRRVTWYSRMVLPHFSFRAAASQLGVVNLGWTAFNGAWWSLTLEVAFYAVVPAIAIWVGLRRSRFDPKVSMAVVAVITAISYLLAPAPARISPWGLVELAFQFLPCFLLGALVARFDLSIRAARTLVAAGAVLVVTAIAFPSLNVHAPFALMWAGVVVLATRGTSRIRNWLAEPHLVWLGERSYSLFLLHFSVFYLVDYLLSLHFPARTTGFDVASRALGLPLALFASMVLFWFVERRLARGLVTARAFWPWEVSARDTGFHGRGWPYSRRGAK